MSITLDELNYQFASVQIIDAAGDALNIAADGSITVSATDLDIRDLTHVSDSVKVGDGTDFLSVNADGSINITDNGGSITVDGSVTVSATDLDIRDLTHVSDSVKVGDGTDFLAVNADGSLNVNTTPQSYSSWQTGADTVTSTAGQLDGTPLSGRLEVEIQNLGNSDIFVGPSNAVTTSNGLKIPKGSSQNVMLDDGAQIWAITASGSSDVRLAEYAA